MTDATSSPMLPLRWSERDDGTESTGHRRDRAATTSGPEAPTPRPGPTGRRPIGPDAIGPDATGPDATGTAGTEPGPPDVEVRISTRRRKSATAFFEQGRIVVVVPSHVRRADRQELVDWLVARLLSKRPRASRSDEELASRAATLGDRYLDGVRPRSIRWVTNQDKRWGSCSTQSGEIRMSHRLQAAPGWVLDATIIHELAHLIHADHSPAFHALAERFPRQREAMIFLEGYSLGIRNASA